MKILKVPISSVVPWDKNPRGIKTEDFERLKKQIQRLGIYKPLVCYRNGKKYVVLGGNMRIRALQELGVRVVEISIVKPKTEAERIEYALSDNDRAGYYEEDKLAELIFPYMAKLNLEDFKVDVGQAVSLKSLLDDVASPGDEDEEPEIKFSEELLEEHNYVVLYFDNSIDWLNAQTLLGLKPVKALHAKKGFMASGVGRVMKGSEAIRRIRGEALE